MELFVGVLGASNSTYVEATRIQQLPDWLGSHQQMFAFFTGVASAIICDQLKTGVTVPCQYEPGLQCTYAEFAQRYGPTRLEVACARAIAVGEDLYATVKLILAAGLDRQPLGAIEPAATGRGDPCFPGLFFVRCRRQSFHGFWGLTAGVSACPPAGSAHAVFRMTAIRAHAPLRPLLLAWAGWATFPLSERIDRALRPTRSIQVQLFRVHPIHELFESRSEGLFDGGTVTLEIPLRQRL